MRRYVALGISIGVLAGLFTWVAGSWTSIGSLKAPLVVWVGFAAWACFYAAGGRTAGLTRTVGSNVTGLVWGWLIFWAASHTSSGSAGVLGLFVAIGAFGMCVQAGWTPLSFIPGAFVGAACYFGNGTTWKGTVISLVVGALLAFASELGADLIEKVAARSKQTAMSGQTA